MSHIRWPESGHDPTDEPDQKPLGTRTLDYINNKAKYSARAGQARFSLNVFLDKYYKETIESENPAPGDCNQSAFYVLHDQDYTTTRVFVSVLKYMSCRVLAKALVLSGLARTIVLLRKKYLRHRKTPGQSFRGDYQYYLLVQSFLGKALCLEECVTFLLYFRRHALALDLVFGIKPEPFSAHCWVECEDAILLDTDFSAHEYVQICRVGLGRGPGPCPRGDCGR
ncbi:lasso peptide biosynthesis B2 protein [Roseibium sp.]|uniref:lasso peptide biosynthesis B2 protein n=1 Tax=Roseibium sp. TaxID=1936156 RepID=UPI003266F4FF